MNSVFDASVLHECSCHFDQQTTCLVPGKWHVIFGICLSQDNYLIFMNSGCALTRWREQRQNPKLIHLPSAISCWPEAATPCDYCMHKMAIWERPYWQKSMVNDNSERKFVVESCKTWIFICLSQKVQRVTTNLVKLSISCVFIINSNFY